MTVNARKKVGKENKSPAASPGELLRQARIARRKPLREVARVLNLPQEHIEALEKDDYSFAPRETYLRGYIFGYAKLVNLPKRKITAALDQALHGAHAAGGEDEDDDEAGATFANFVARLSIPTLVLLLFGLLVSWWFFYEGRVQENFMRHMGGLQ